MDRRTFLRQVAAFSAGATLTPLFNIPAVLAADAPSPANPLLSIVKGKDYAALAAKVLEPLGGIKAFVKAGSRVVVKPNIGWDRKPEQGANTNPDIVKAIVKLALDAGAKQVLVFDRSVNDARRCYTNSGILAAVESLNDPRAQCVYQDQKKFIPVNIENGKSINKFAFYKDALESDCDCYINIPIAKHHSLSKLTLGLKNAMGVIGGNRGEIHQQNIHQRIVDLNLVIKPKLTIMDATRILLRNGPSGGKLEDLKVLDTIAASADMVAVDAYATTLFGMKPDEVGATVAAANMGLGQIDLAKVKVVEA
jgi:uncharacterized protein (DUF362 family)